MNKRPPSKMDRDAPNGQNPLAGTGNTAVDAESCINVPPYSPELDDHTSTCETTRKFTHPQQEACRNHIPEAIAGLSCSSKGQHHTGPLNFQMLTASRIDSVSTPKLSFGVPPN